MTLRGDASTHLQDRLPSDCPGSAGPVGRSSMNGYRPAGAFFSLDASSPTTAVEELNGGWEVVLTAGSKRLSVNGPQA